MMNKEYYVYILASKKFGTLYTGITNDPLRRVYEHRKNLISGFTKKYGIHMLVWLERHEDVHEAILREKRIKKWRREWKINLIERYNPQWLDLWDEIWTNGSPPSRG